MWRYYHNVARQLRRAVILDPPTENRLKEEAVNEFHVDAKFVVLLDPNTISHSGRIKRIRMNESRGSIGAPANLVILNEESLSTHYGSCSILVFVGTIPPMF